MGTRESVADKFAEIGARIAYSFHELYDLSLAIGKDPLEISQREMFLHVFDHIPNVDSILKTPTLAHVPTDIFTISQLSSGLGNIATSQNFDAIAIYCARLPAGYCNLPISNAAKINPELKNSEAYKRHEWRYRLREEHEEDIGIRISLVRQGNWTKDKFSTWLRSLSLPQPQHQKNERWLDYVLAREKEKIK